MAWLSPCSILYSYMRIKKLDRRMGQCPSHMLRLSLCVDAQRAVATLHRTAARGARLPKAIKRLVNELAEHGLEAHVCLWEALDATADPLEPSKRLMPRLVLGLLGVSRVTVIPLSTYCCCPGLPIDGPNPTKRGGPRLVSLPCRA